MATGFALLKEYSGLAIGPKLEQTANDWCNSNVFPDRFTGTLADLTALMNTQAQSCATYVTNETLAYNKAEAITACQAKLQQRYSAVLQRLQGEQKQAVDAIRNGLIGNTGNSNTILIILAIAVVIFIIFVLL